MDTPTSAAAKIEVTPASLFTEKELVNLFIQARIEAIKSASMGSTMVVPSTQDKITNGETLFKWIVQDLLPPTEPKQ